MTTGQLSESILFIIGESGLRPSGERFYPDAARIPGRPRFGLKGF